MLNDGEEPKKAKPVSTSKASAPATTTSVKAKSKINDSISTPEEGEEDLTNPNLPLSLQGMCVTGMNAPVNSSLATVLNMKKGKKEEEAADVDLIENRLLKPLPQYGGDKEMKTLCDVISREIYQESPNVR